MLTLENIDITLSKGTKLECQVLKKLNLRVADGEFIVVIGSNGSGKSTMFNVISGFLKPDSGTIKIDGQDVTSLLQTARAYSVAKVMQDPRVGTMENMTLFENMAFALKRGRARGLNPFSNIDRKRLFQEKLSMLGIGLENRLDELVANLSGGQRQALSLMMAIIADSKILLLDEITAALDPKTAENVMQLANKMIREEKRTCIMITHNMAQAIEYGDRTLVLKKGEFTKEFSFSQKKQLTPGLLATEFEEI